MKNTNPAIAMYGNIANNYYVIGKALKQYTDLDIHLYLEDEIDLVQSPESEDPHLKGNYPSWIHKSKIWSLGSIFRLSSKNIITELSKYDIVLLSGRGVVLAPYIKSKTIFYVTGSDLTLIPFYQTYTLIYRTGKIKSWFGQVLQRKGIRSFDEIWTQPFSPFVDALNKLKVHPEKIKSKYFPVMVDNKLFQPDPAAYQSQDKNLRAIVDNFKFVVFHPSRLMINDHPKLKAAGQWKQNDLLFYAFADFVKTVNAHDAVLVMPDRTVSHDVVTAKTIVKKLGIEKNVLWIKAEHAEGFTRKELIKFYTVSDVVADDFGIGWFGSVVLEGFSMKKPVLSYVDEEVMKKLYPWHPFLSSNTREGNCDLLCKLYRDSAYKKAQGELGRKWIEEFHSQDSASKIYVEQFNKILNKT